MPCVFEAKQRGQYAWTRVGAGEQNAAEKLAWQSEEGKKSLSRVKDGRELSPKGQIYSWKQEWLRVCTPIALTGRSIQCSSVKAGPLQGALQGRCMAPGRSA